jgi:multidrug efflux pump subunit AcrB
MRWLRAHRRSLLVFAALLAITGLLSIPGLPVSLFPITDFPRVVVTLDAGDRNAEQMVLQITQPVEEAIRRVPNVKTVRSITSRGATDISASFAWGTDMASATLAINAALSQTLPSLPTGITLTTRRMDPTVFPILAYSLRSDTLSATALHDLAAYTLRPLLAGVDGVAHVDVQGGAREEYQVGVDPARLRAMGVTLADVTSAVTASTSLDALGRATDFYKLYLLLADNHPINTAAIADTVVKSTARGVIRVGDVATVIMGSSPQWIRATADGRDAVLLQVFQQRDGNTAAIAQEVINRLATFKPRLPKDVTIAEWYNQSDLIKASATSVRDAIFIGIGLAGLILWVFLRSGRLLALALLVVPATLACTVLILRTLGLTFNLMTLGGIAAAVGLVIDDVIVMAEHIARRLSKGHLVAVTGGSPTWPTPNRWRPAAAARPLVRASADGAARAFARQVPAACGFDESSAGSGDSDAAEPSDAAPEPWLTLLREAQSWSPPKFPLSGADAAAAGIAAGPAMGAALRAAEVWWIEQDFQPDRDALIGRLRP